MKTRRWATVPATSSVATFRSSLVTVWSWLGNVVGSLSNLGIYKGLSYLYDEVLWPIMVGWLGAVQGGTIMSSVLLLNAYLLWHSKKGTDILNLGKIRRWEDVRLIRSIVNFYIGPFQVGDIISASVLTIQVDNFVATAYLRVRQGRMTGRITLGDWIFFAISGVVTCTYSTAKSWLVAKVAIFVWSLL